MKYLLILLSISSISVNAQNKFSIEKEVPTFAISYDDLNAIIQEGLYLISKYDSSFAEGEIVINIEQNNETQTINSLEAFDKLQFKEANSFNFRYSNYKSQISKLQMRFSDYSRTIEIEGNNYLELQTVMSSILEPLKSKRTLFRGPFIRFLSFSFLLVIGIFFTYNIKLIQIGNDGIVYRKRKGYLFVLLGCSIILTLLLLMSGLIETETIFPGFSLVKNEINFIDKYSGLIGFIGLIIGIIGMPFFQLFFKKPSK